MKKTVLVFLTMVFLQTFHPTTFAQTPQTIQGTWIVDIKATEELLKSSPPPPQDLQWISLSSGLMFQMIYEFTDSAIAVSSYTSKKTLLYQLLPGEDNKLRYGSVMKQTGRDDIWIVNVINDDRISISSSQSPATKYFLLKRIKLDPNMRAEDGKRAFEAWKVWAQALAPVLAPNGKVETPKSALWEAITNKNSEKAKALISPNADVNYADQQGNSVLHYALSLENAELIEMLVAAGATVDAQNNRGETPLHWAAGGGIGAKSEDAMLKMAEVLIAHGADVNKMSSTYGMPLNKAAYSNKIQMAKLLIAHGADVEGNGASPLWSASVNGDYAEMAQLLVDSGAGVNTRAANGSYPLHAAAFHEKVTRFLLSRGAIPNALDAKGFTALYLAAGSDYGAAAAEALLNHGADPNAKNMHGGTALHQAASQGAVKVMRLLLANRADVNAATNDGYTPLHGAVSYGNNETRRSAVEVLLKSGANVNAKTSRDGETPFHKAISRGDVEMVKLLLDYGADVNAVSKFGVTSLYFARNSTAITELLQKHGAH